jgi:hypothetical protein
MIQRIQSIYLLAIVLISVLLFFLPISTKIIPADVSKNIPKIISYKVDLSGIEKYENATLISSTKNYILCILNIATGVLAAVIIFLYKKRRVQIKFSRLGILIVTAFIAVDFYFSDSLGKEYGPDISTIYLSGSYFPVIQIILLILAIRAIKKDDELVRSADRIR